MAVNRDKPNRWKKDIAESVDLYNNWFIDFAPKAFRDTRQQTAKDVQETLHVTENLSNVAPAVLRANPGILPTLRMCTCPPLARDRLTGLSGAAKGLIDRMETEQKLPIHITSAKLDKQLQKIGDIIQRLADGDILTWLAAKSVPGEAEIYRAATVIADRLCGATSDPIIRNAQEQRQLHVIAEWLDARGYNRLPTGSGTKFGEIEPGWYAFRLNVPVRLAETGKSVNVPADAVVMPRRAAPRALPLLIEAKSAGDFTNVNKRRKEEAQKIGQLRKTYGPRIQYILFLCGYFDSGYLGYEAAEGIDWVWEHRIDDLAKFGL